MNVHYEIAHLHVLYEVLYLFIAVAASSAAETPASAMSVREAESAKISIVADDSVAIEALSSLDQPDDVAVDSPKKKRRSRSKAKKSEGEDVATTDLAPVQLTESESENKAENDESPSSPKPLQIQPLVRS